MVMSCETNKGRVDNYRGGKKAKAGSNNKLKMKEKIHQEATQMEASIQFARTITRFWLKMKEISKKRYAVSKLYLRAFL